MTCDQEVLKGRRMVNSRLNRVWMGMKTERE
jgi:hypothetical protein